MPFSALIVWGMKERVQANIHQSLQRNWGEQRVRMESANRLFVAVGV
jgi:hypothetical protein